MCTKKTKVNCSMKIFPKCKFPMNLLFFIRDYSTST